MCIPAKSATKPISQPVIFKELQLVLPRLLCRKVRVNKVSTSWRDEMRRSLARFRIISCYESCSLIPAGIAIGSTEDKIVLPKHAIDRSCEVLGDGHNVIVGEQLADCVGLFGGNLGLENFGNVVSQSSGDKMLKYRDLTALWVIWIAVKAELNAFCNGWREITVGQNIFRSFLDCTNT